MLVRWYDRVLAVLFIVVFLVIIGAVVYDYCTPVNTVYGTYMKVDDARIGTSDRFSAVVDMGELGLKRTYLDITQYATLENKEQVIVYYKNNLMATTVVKVTKLEEEKE